MKILQKKNLCVLPTGEKKTSIFSPFENILSYRGFWGRIHFWQVGIVHSLLCSDLSPPESLDRSLEGTWKFFFGMDIC